MFTGLVEEKGRVRAITRLPGESARIAIAATEVLRDTKLGDSIAVNGVCLTVAELGEGSFVADMMSETLKRTAMADLAVDDEVNLERAVLADTRLGGHIVQGHVDGVGEFISVTASEHWTTLRISMPDSLAGYVAEQGSITVDGVSLTVVAVSEVSPPDVPAANKVVDRPIAPRHWFEVSLIPTTQVETTLGAAAVGNRVNLEVDVIAKYVDRLLSVGRS